MAEVQAESGIGTPSREFGSIMEASIGPTPALPPPMPGSPAAMLGAGAVSDKERLQYEEERARMYQQMDEKDDEIQSTSQMAERLKQQMMEQEDLIKQSKSDYEMVQVEMTRIQMENEAAKEEVKEVLQALEELAMNYDQKTTEAESRSKENETLTDELQLKLVWIYYYRPM